MNGRGAIATTMEKSDFKTRAKLPTFYLTKQHNEIAKLHYFQ
jgi:hypothetical protein